MSVSQDLSVLIAQAEFRALPPDVVGVAKTVILDGLAVTLAGSVEPPAMRYTDRGAPQTGLEGKFSFQYTVAAALLDGHISMATFTDEQVRRPAIAELLAKTQLRMDPTIPANFDEMRTTVSVQMRDGKEFAVRCDRPRGIWDNPLTREERLTKVRQCAARVLPNTNVERLIGMVEDLEHASHQDIAALIGLLAQSPVS